MWISSAASRRAPGCRRARRPQGHACGDRQPAVSLDRVCARRLHYPRGSGRKDGLQSNRRMPGDLARLPCASLHRVHGQDRRSQETSVINPDGTPGILPPGRWLCRQAWRSGTSVLCATMAAKLRLPREKSLNFCNRVSPSITRSSPHQSRCWRRLATRCRRDGKHLEPGRKVGLSFFGGTTLLPLLHPGGRRVSTHRHLQACLGSAARGAARSSAGSCGSSIRFVIHVVATHLLNNAIGRDSNAMGSLAISDTSMRRIRGGLCR